MINGRAYNLIRDYHIEFFVGCIYETRNRRRVVCIFNDLPGTKSVLLMELETPEDREIWLKLYIPKLRGQYYEMIQSNEDIVLMVPDEPIVELMAENKVLKDRVRELRDSMRAVENFGNINEDDKEWHNNWYEIFINMFKRDK